jgi:hypothetical protein
MKIDLSFGAFSHATPTEFAHCLIGMSYKHFTPNGVWIVLSITFL